MPRWICISNRIILHIREAIQALRVRRVRNDAVRLDKMVDKANSPILRKKYKLLKFRHEKNYRFSIRKRNHKSVSSGVLLVLKKTKTSVPVKQINRVNY